MAGQKRTILQLAAATMSECKYSTCSEVAFEYLSFFFEQVAAAKGKRKADHLRAFRKKYVQRSSDDIFEIYRLILPALDKLRGNYWLKEAKLASALIKACGLDPKTSADAQSALNWKKFGTSRAGNFSSVMEEYLFRKHCGKQDGTAEVATLTVGQLNDKLTELAVTDDTNDKAECLRWLIVRSSATQMRWVVQIILKDLKVGLSETRLFRDFHPDAEDLYNVTMDLERVCKELKDPNKRYPRKDVEPGNAARPQLASRADSTESAFKKMRGKAFVVEVKFDGERVQLHRDGSQFWYFSRRGKEHGSRSVFDVFNTVASKQLIPERCILDGEMIVWNKIRKCFEPFGTLRTAILAAKNRKSEEEILEIEQLREINTAKVEYEIPQLKDILLIYIPFDVLFIDEQSIINRTLKERQEVLATSILGAPETGHQVGQSGLRGAVVPLLPGRRFLSETPFSKVGHSLQDIQDVYDVALDRQEEGIVLKSLDSQWRLNDRSSSWLKVKPDYLANHEIDAVIIGCCYGTGRHGGKISEYLLGLGDMSGMRPGGEASVFISFCRVGTGVSDAEREAIRQKLGNNMLEAGAPPPKCYRLSGNSKERPDAWVKDPLSSIVLQVKADIRTIVSKVFAAKYSLRFPRVDRIRWDKAPSEAMTEQELARLVESNQGLLVGGEKPASAQKKTKPKVPTPTKPLRPTVVPYFIPSDVSGVDVDQNVLDGSAVCFLNYGADSKHDLEVLVKKLGGTVYMGVTPTVKYVLAGDDEEHYKVKGVIRSGKRDILSLEWLKRCAKQRQLLPMRPQDFVYRAKKGESSLGYLLDYPTSLEFTAEDVKRILKVHMSSTDPLNATGENLEAMVSEVKQLVGQLHSKWTVFQGCTMLFVPGNLDSRHGGVDPPICERMLDGTDELIQMVDSSSKSFLSSQWQQAQLDVRLCGGKLALDLKDTVTHIVLSDKLSVGRDILQCLVDNEASMAMLGWLKQCLACGDVKLASTGWIDACFASGVAVDVEEGPWDQASGWPWEEFGVSSIAGVKRQREAADDGGQNEATLKKAATGAQKKATGGRGRGRGRGRATKLATPRKPPARGGHMRSLKAESTEESEQEMDDVESPSAGTTGKASVECEEESSGDSEFQLGGEDMDEFVTPPRRHKYITRRSGQLQQPVIQESDQSDCEEEDADLDHTTTPEPRSSSKEQQSGSFRRVISAVAVSDPDKLDHGIEPGNHIGSTSQQSPIPDSTEQAPGSASTAQGAAKASGSSAYERMAALLAEHGSLLQSCGDREKETNFPKPPPNEHPPCGFVGNHVEGTEMEVVDHAQQIPLLAGVKESSGDLKVPSFATKSLTADRTSISEQKTEGQAEKTEKKSLRDLVKAALGE